jgi:hypothetical protein
MSASFSSRIALADTLQNIHRDIVVRTLRQKNGIELETWNEDAIRALPFDKTEFIHWDLVRYNRSGDHPRVELPSPLLGASAILLRSSETPRDVLASFPIGDSSTAERVENAIARQNLYAHKLEFDTPEAAITPWSERDKPGLWGCVFVLPDSPPLAIDGYRLRHTMHTRFEDGEYRCHQDSDLIQKVEDDFGPEAIEYVPEDTCAAIVRALRASDAWTAVIGLPPQQSVA